VAEVFCPNCGELLRVIAAADVESAERRQEWIDRIAEAQLHEAQKDEGP
jgi:hypothetical protein